MVRRRKLAAKSVGKRITIRIPASREFVRTVRVLVMMLKSALLSGLKERQVRSLSLNATCDYMTAKYKDKFGWGTVGRILLSL